MGLFQEGPLGTNGLVATTSVDRASLFDGTNYLAFPLAERQTVAKVGDGRYFLKVFGPSACGLGWRQFARTPSFPILQGTTFSCW